MSAHTFWRGFWRGFNDRRVWVWIYPAFGAANLAAYVIRPSGGRWVSLAFAVGFFVATGWLWREQVASRRVRRLVETYEWQAAIRDAYREGRAR